MFASFFGKSKPINFLLVATGMALGYCVVNFVPVPQTLSAASFFEKLGLLVVYLLSMLLMDFIAKRNRLTKRNSFAMLLFALFTIWFPDILRNGTILIAGFFVLLAVRRFLAMKSGIDIKKKIFDATFWICLGSLFFEWSLLFLILVFLAVLFYEAADYRNWLVPLVAIATVFMLATCYFLLMSNSFFEWQRFFPAPNWNFEISGPWWQFVPLSAICVFSVGMVGHYIFQLRNAPSTMKSSMALILGILIVALLVILCSSSETHGEILFLIVPIAIIGANYFETPGQKRFKNGLLLLLVLVSMVFPFLA